MTARRVLVTGAGGFIGSHLAADQLARGHRVIALDVNTQRLRSAGEQPGLQVVEGDLRDGALLDELLAGVDVVFHLASAHLEVNLGAGVFHAINVAAARDLAQRAARAGVQRFVHCSSVGVYGPLAEVPASETTVCRPDIAYEITKLEGEQAVRDVAAETGLPLVILRPAWVYGPGCPRTAKLFRALRKRRFLMVGRGRNLRHPVYIDDMLQAFELAAVREGIEGGLFVIASDRYVTLRQLIDAILAVEGSGYRPPAVPLSLMWPVCLAAEAAARLLRREPPFSRRSLKFFTEDSAFDITLARQRLGFRPAIGLEEGLRRTRAAAGTDAAPGQRAGHVA